jgi:hypothetical protein
MLFIHVELVGSLVEVPVNIVMLEVVAQDLFIYKNTKILIFLQNIIYKMQHQLMLSHMVIKKLS